MFSGSFIGNLLGTVYFALFISGGIYISLKMFSFSSFQKIWLGTVIGIALLMWLPMISSVLLGFNILSHTVALLLLAGLDFCAWFFNKKNKISLSFEKDELISLAFIIPTCIFYAVVETNHIMQPNEAGGMVFGQSTYYDANIHLSFITTPVAQGTIPFAYNIFPTQQVSYPFLSDTVSSSVYIWGSSLRFAYIMPTVVAAFTVFTGVFIFFYTWLKKFAKAIVAWILFFFNGGFGFFYFFDGLKSNTENFTRIFNDLYKTPTNFNEKMIRWVNTVCDMMIPQRATLFGWMMLFATMYLLYRAVFKKEKNLYVYAGIMAGLTPLISTHMFLSLGIIAAVWMLSRLYVFAGYKAKTAGKIAVGILCATVLVFGFVCLNTGKNLTNYNYDKAGVAALFVGGISVAAIYVFLILRCCFMKNGFREMASTWGIFLLSVLVLALPQLILFTFRQSGNSGFLRPHFNWINSQDEYLWFYIKNVGVCALLIIPAVLSGSKRLKSIVAPAIVLLLIADTYALQPNPYDNNKILYPAYALICGAVAEYAVLIYSKIKDIKGTKLVVAFMAVVCTVSAVLSMGREAISDQYQMYDGEQVKASQWIDENLDSQVVILTNDRYNNAITSLTGRNIVCGSNSFLSPHGISKDYDAVQNDIKQMYSNASSCNALFEKYKVTHILVGPDERSSYQVNDGEIAKIGKVVYSSGNVQIYELN